MCSLESIATQQIQYVLSFVFACLSATFRSYAGSMAIYWPKGQSQLGKPCVSSHSRDVITEENFSLDLTYSLSAGILSFEHLRPRFQSTVCQLHVQGPRSRTRLLGSFWCPSTACNLVMATGQGLELYQLSPKGQGLRYMGSRKHPTTWCTYSHQSRIALLATGEGGQWLQVRPLALYTDTYTLTSLHRWLSLYESSMYGLGNITSHCQGL